MQMRIKLNINKKRIFFISILSIIIIIVSFIVFSQSNNPPQFPGPQSLGLRCGKDYQNKCSYSPGMSYAYNCKNGELFKEECPLGCTKVGGRAECLEKCGTCLPSESSSLSCYGNAVTKCVKCESNKYKLTTEACKDGEFCKNNKCTKIKYVVGPQISGMSITGMPVASPSSPIGSPCNPNSDTPFCMGNVAVNCVKNTGGTGGTWTGQTCGNCIGNNCPCATMDHNGDGASDEAFCDGSCGQCHETCDGNKRIFCEECSDSNDKIKLRDIQQCEYCTIINGNVYSNGCQ